MLVIQPLNERLINSVYTETKNWGPFQTQDKVINYLEDRLTSLVTCMSHDAVGDRTSSKSLQELINLHSFYTVVLLRHLQQTIALPKDVQHLSIYDTSEGNQVDKYLNEFFSKTLP